MAYVTSINIHDVGEITARAVSSNGTSWLALKFHGADTMFDVGAFMDFDVAQRFADAINMAAHNAPEPTADPVITWPRPSYYQQAKASTFMCVDCGGHDVKEGTRICQRCRDYARDVQPTGQVLR